MTSRAVRACSEGANPKIIRQNPAVMAVSSPFSDPNRHWVITTFNLIVSLLLTQRDALSVHLPWVKNNSASLLSRQISSSLHTQDANDNIQLSHSGVRPKGQPTAKRRKGDKLQVYSDRCWNAIVWCPWTVQEARLGNKPDLMDEFTVLELSCQHQAYMSEKQMLEREEGRKEKRGGKKL